MPALDNIRHERFARLWIKTGDRNEAYRKAVAKTDNKGSIWTGSYRTFKNVRVQRRIKELQKQMATRNRITVDSLVEELEQDRALARALGQPSAAVAAVQLKARLSGLLVDRKETGGPGDFTALQTPDEVLAAVRRELGDAAADMLLASVAPKADEALSQALPDPGATVN